MSEQDLISDDQRHGTANASQSAMSDVREDSNQGTHQLQSSAFPDDTVEKLFSDQNTARSRGTSLAISADQSQQHPTSVPDAPSDASRGVRFASQQGSGLDNLDAADLFDDKDENVERLQISDIPGVQGSQSDAHSTAEDSSASYEAVFPRERIVISNVSPLSGDCQRGCDHHRGSTSTASGHAYKFGKRWSLGSEMNHEDQIYEDTREAQERIFDDAMSESRAAYENNISPLDDLAFESDSIPDEEEDSEEESVIEDEDSEQYESEAESVLEDREPRETNFLMNMPNPPIGRDPDAIFDLPKFNPSYEPPYSAEPAALGTRDVSSLTALVGLIRQQISQDPSGALDGFGKLAKLASEVSTATYHTGKEHLSSLGSSSKAKSIASRGSRPPYAERIASTQSVGSTLTLSSSSILRAFGGVVARPASTASQYSYTDTPNVEDLMYVDPDLPIDDSLELHLATKIMLLPAVSILNALSTDKSTLVLANAGICAAVDCAIRQNASEVIRARVAFYMGVCRLLQSKAGEMTSEAVKWFKAAIRAKGIFLEGDKAANFVRGLSAIPGEVQPLREEGQMSLISSSEAPW